MNEIGYSSADDVRKKKTRIVIDDDRGGYTYLGIGGNGMPLRRQVEDFSFGIFFAILFTVSLLLMGIVFAIFFG